MLINEPKFFTGAAPIEFYTIHVFQDKKAWGKQYPATGKAYTTFRGAERAAKNAMQKTGAWSVTIRKETIYKRTDNAEFSTSGIAKNYYNYALEV